VACSFVLFAPECVLLESNIWKVSVTSGKMFVCLFVCIVLCVGVWGIRKEKNKFEGIREGNRFARMMRPIQRNPSVHIS